MELTQVFSVIFNPWVAPERLIWDEQRLERGPSAGCGHQNAPCFTATGIPSLKLHVLHVQLYFSKFY